MAPSARGPAQGFAGIRMSRKKFSWFVSSWILSMDNATNKKFIEVKNPSVG